MCFLFTFFFLVFWVLDHLREDSNEKFYLKKEIEETWLNFLKLYGQNFDKNFQVSF